MRVCLQTESSSPCKLRGQFSLDNISPVHACTTILLTDDKLVTQGWRVCNRSVAKICMRGSELQVSHIS